MKNKEIPSILAIFAIMVFATPFIENKTASYIWILFFITSGVLAIASISKNPIEIIEGFRNQHIILQILDVSFIIAFIYGIITMNVVSISWILLSLIVVIPICQWFLKKRNS